MEVLFYCLLSTAKHRSLYKLGDIINKLKYINYLLSACLIHIVGFASCFSEFNQQ